MRESLRPEPVRECRLQQWHLARWATCGISGPNKVGGWRRHIAAQRAMLSSVAESQPVHHNREKQQPDEQHCP